MLKINFATEKQILRVGGLIKKCGGTDIRYMHDFSHASLKAMYSISINSIPTETWCNFERSIFKDYEDGAKIEDWWRRYRIDDLIKGNKNGIQLDHKGLRIMIFPREQWIRQQEWMTIPTCAQNFYERIQF